MSQFQQGTMILVKE
ncbi:hypothetical protein NQ314_008868 [Rhamnusium bicolor]|uniref:Uncharacterized protein n=1 Tax=Rhamnusium bicolor TaxID=1586634 RepID=A0AAV8Y755_9CUCU|nr:hypothetical protein NQ314_008868 [Rhamnusium bicolor]